MSKPYQLFSSLAVSTVLFVATAARAQLIYSEDFSNPNVSTNWAVNYADAGSNYVNFQFDYTTVGIPQAPHSTGGNTKGLKMSPDITTGAQITGAVNGLSVSPTNFSVTANFDMHADMWINYNGAGVAGTNVVVGGGGSGSTIVYGCGYGTVGTAAQVAGGIDSILCGTETDSGSSAEVRMYGPLVAGSYQNGVYQSSGTAIPAYPGEPFVYNNPSGTRAFYTQSTFTGVPTPNWTNFFPSVKPPLAQVNLYPQQTNIQCNLGAPDFAWHDVEVQKVGNVIVYLIDGQVAATGNYSSAGTPSGDKLLFTAFDINSSPSTDTNFVNLNFVVFANIVVSNFPTVVNVTASTPTASEAAPGTPGVFTLTRSSTTGPLTVNFTLTGTATNGVQYQTVPLNVTFPDGQSTATVNINPIDDGVSHPTTVVALNLQPGQGFAAAGSAVVNILDNDQPTVDISGSSQAYGRYTNTVGTGNNDFVLLSLTRRGKLITGAPLTVNLSYSGSAANGQDYTQVPSVSIPDGSSSNAVIISPVYDASVYTNRTFTVTVASGTGYAVGTGTGTGTIIPATYVPAPVIFTDALTNANDATNWNLVYGSGDTMFNTNNFSADFGFDLTAAAGGAIPPPPSGDSHALHLTVNKALTPGAPGAINAYYTNKLLSGNFAVRFQMNLIQGSPGSGNTEGAIFGINHSGSLSNWIYGSGFITNINWASDGIWYFMTAQPAGVGAGDYHEYTGNGGTNGNTGWQRLATKTQFSFTDNFKENPGPFTAIDATGTSQTPGVPANEYTAAGYDNSTWADVEIKQQDGIVTLSINRTQIFSYTNTTVWKGGYLMLGYSDPFGGSIGGPEAGVYYANLQVVQLPTVRIDSIAIPGANDVITFTTSDPLDNPASFNLLTSTNILGTFTNLTGTYSPVSGTQFQVTTPFTGGTKRFFKVTHK